MLFRSFSLVAVVEGYSELIKELLETHPVGKNPLGFRNQMCIRDSHTCVYSEGKTIQRYDANME